MLAGAAVVLAPCAAIHIYKHSNIWLCYYWVWGFMYLKEFWELWVSLGLPYTATQHDEQERGVSHPQVIKSRPVPFSMDCVYETPQPSCLSVNGRPSFFLCWQKAELVKNFWFNKDKFSTGTKLQLPSAALQWGGLQSLGSCDVLGVHWHPHTPNHKMSPSRSWLCLL